MSDWPPTGNRRVDALLNAALHHGLTVEKSEHAADCWTIRGNNGHSLTIYGGTNHSADVMGDLPGNRDWAPVTQRHARSLMVNGAFWLEGSQR